MKKLLIIFVVFLFFGCSLKKNLEENKKQLYIELGQITQMYGVYLYMKEQGLDSLGMTFDDNRIDFLADSILTAKIQK